MVLLLLAFVVCLALMWLLRHRRAPSRLPPAPPGLPLLGNALQIPRELLFLKLDAWRAQLGDIFSVNVAGQTIIVLSNAKIAADILDRMSAVTSSRPHSVMAGEIMTQNSMYVSMQPGDRWRRLRRVTHEGFNIRAVEAFFPFQESEASNLIQSLLKNQANLGKQLHHAASSAIWRSLYSGPSLTTEDEKKIRKTEIILAEWMEASMPMKYLVDSFPILKQLPTWAARWKKYGMEFFLDADQFFKTVMHEGSQQKEGIRHVPGWIASSTESFQRFSVTEDEAAWTAGGLFGAGGETTGLTLHYFALAMVLNPDVARKAQMQIDAVVGNRPPTFEDRDSLPYVRAMVKEVLRWRPALPLCIPHVASQDFNYGEYIIPKGAQIIGNVWSINRDPRLFPDYEAFRPERFLDSDGNLKKAMPDYNDEGIVLGFGRRRCPGAHFANNSLFIDIAYLMWAFDFRKAVDGNGKEITPSSTEFVDRGLTIHPATFPYLLTPRRPDLVEKIAYYKEAYGE